MATVEVTVDGLAAALRGLGNVSRRVEIAAQRALLKTAHHVRNAEREEMARVFDRPTKWTLGAIRVRPVPPGVVEVGVVDPEWTRANNYLLTQAQGGSSRRHKAFENMLTRAGVLPRGWYAVAGEAAELDAYGNVKASQIRQILSWFDAAEAVAGSTQNMGEKGRDKRRRGTKRTRGFEYFAAQPGFRIGRRSWVNGREQNLTPGIYKRTRFGFGSAIQPVLIFVERTGYQPRFDFLGVARRTVQATAQTEFRAALARAGVL